MMMETRNLLVSILAIVVMTLALTAGVSAHRITSTNVYINGVDVTNVTAPYREVIYPGDTISIKVVFSTDSTVGTDDEPYLEDVTIEAEIDGYNNDISQKVYVGKALRSKTYTKTLSLKIPYDLKDDLSDGADLQITIEGEDEGVDFSDDVASIRLEVQRVPFDAGIMSVNTPQTVEAGAMLPVDIVIKNKGANDLDDLYVKATISALGVARTAYFGDIVAFENCDDDCDEKDTVSGRIFLQIPDNAKAGTYAVEVEVSNDDTVSTGVVQVLVKSELAGNNVITTDTSKNVAVGENAEYSLLIVNPSNKLKVYRIVPEASTDLTVSVSESVIAVPAGSSKTVKITANSALEGKYSLNVNVLSGEELVQKVVLTTDVKGTANKTSITSPIVVLTIVLAVIFVVLLIVLITLLGKKPSKNEEFGESYY